MTYTEIDKELEKEFHNIPHRMAFKIGEVAKLLDIRPSILRYWEGEFEELRPPKSSSNQRAYRQQDIRAAFMIKKLLYKDRFSIEGAKAILKKEKFKSSALLKKDQNFFLSPSKKDNQSIEIKKDSPSEFKTLLDFKSSELKKVETSQLETQDLETKGLETKNLENKNLSSKLHSTTLTDRSLEEKKQDLRDKAYEGDQVKAKEWILKEKDFQSLEAKIKKIKSSVSELKKLLEREDFLK